MCFNDSRNPTPPAEGNSPLDLEWLPVNDTSHPQYLDITGAFSMKTDPEAIRVRLWDWLYDNYATNKS